jgi:hypothetical protein
MGSADIGAFKEVFKRSMRQLNVTRESILCSFQCPQRSPFVQLGSVAHHLGCTPAGISWGSLISFGRVILLWNLSAESIHPFAISTA